jgi:hypothetical protein
MNKITYPLRRRMKRPEVVDLQDALQLLLDRGMLLADDEGLRRELSTALRNERAQQTFGGATGKLVGRFQKEHRLRATGVVDAETAAAINAEVDSRVPPGRPSRPTPPAPSPEGSPEPADEYSVEGTVTSPNRAGLGRLRVVIVDRNAGPEVPLAETTTDDRGRYQVRFPVPAAYLRKKPHLDLQAWVHLDKAFLAASEVRYGAESRETLDVKLPAEAAGLPSEYETLAGAVAEHFAGRLADLEETDERQDLTYLANKTGWDARVVALAALAEQFSRQTGSAALPPEAFYALFRAGLPADEDALYRVDSGTLESVWKKSTEQGIIPTELADRIPRMIDQFRGLSAQKLLAAPARVGVSSLTDMLAESRLDAADRTRFAQLYATHRADLPTFWKAATEAFGKETTARLQLDGKLSYLTINNAPLIAKLHQDAGVGGLQVTTQLAQRGYYRAAAWHALLADGTVAVPPEIPGDTPEAKRDAYAGYLASQVRLAFPTAAVADMVKSGDFATLKVPDQVESFLTTHQKTFQLGVQPVEQYIADQKLQVPPAAVAELKSLQRVYQITPSDQAMTGLLNRGLDAAYHVVRYPRDAFVQSFANDLGGAAVAARTYDKAAQVHHAVLNVAVSYLGASNAPGIGMHSPPHFVDPLPPAANAGDVIAFATLESLFGAMDFCSCEHCRSILSPAAYLVDLLTFIDDPTPPAGSINPQTVLAARRPDLLQLPLTCENTNTVLPYIDVVNEIMEYFIANGVRKLSLNEYVGHDTNGAATEDLLASPQFVMDAAYTTLRDTVFPPPLPFHQPLESLRRYFAKFEVPLPLAMERLRKGDALERGGDPYGWRDILMETAGLSRVEYEILTDSATVPLASMYGFVAGTADAAIIAALSGAKAFSQRVGISYEDLVAVLKTRFVNPSSVLVPKLERLGVEFVTLEALHRTPQTILDADFNALLPTGPDAVDVGEFGGDPVAWDAGGRNTAPIIRAWLNAGTRFDEVMNLITLMDPTGVTDSCNFDRLELRLAKPMAAIGDNTTRLGAVEFVRLLRFIRLWRRTGWTIEQTDAVICALFRADLAPLGGGDVDTVAKLDAGLANVVPRIGVLLRVMTALNLQPKRALLPLLACWSPIGTHGASALYRQLFNPTLLRDDPDFADNGYGEFLVDSTKMLAAHAATLRAAFSLSGDEYDRIVQALTFGAATPLTLSNVSAIYRVGYLARILRLSVRELLLLTTLTGLDPFAVPDLTDPAIMRIIALVQALKERSLKTSAALYLVWNQDLSGKAAPTAAVLSELALALRGDFAAIEDQFAVTEDPGGDLARARMTLVYGQEASDAFFALLDDTLVLDVPYTHGVTTLEPEIVESDAGIGYDDFRHRLSHAGLLSAASQAALKAVAGVSGAFKDAVDMIFARSEDAKGSFFTRFPELQPLSAVYIASADPPAVKRGALLAAFRPELARRRKRQQALQRLAAAIGAEESMARTLVDPVVAPGAVYPLHAATQLTQPAMNDVLALETPGLTVDFFFRNTATGTVGMSVPAAANLDYSVGGSNPLPPNPILGEPISGIWRGSVETPESGYHNFVIEADAGATVSLTIGGIARPLTQNGTVRRNTDPMELKGGTLYEITVTVERVTDAVSVKWETLKRPRQVIPSRYLYPTTILGPFGDAYVRLLKATALAAGLRLSAREIAHFATHADYRIGGDGWLNALPVIGNAAHPTEIALLAPLRAMLDYARIKAAVAPDDDSVLDALEDPAAATATADSPLFALTGWSSATLPVLLAWFGAATADLGHMATFARVYDAFFLSRQMGFAIPALLPATTNEPTADTTRDMQAALRARYAPADWREVVRPINDELRGRQRDALVAYILHQLRSDPATAHIDTADKLFEYFLMDVQMEPCTQTSRIRHALSSVQLFIERCLMDLERTVSPASLNVAQWEWMKRYRVWEANRKVFLFPENWLDCALLDIKSPFFKEIETALLQSDITEDSAATALLTYLSRLEEVAKLEPCGIYHVEGDPSLRTGDVDHVIARTAGAHRKYFYRRYEYGYWTPWEQIKLDIEDNPVIPVIWKGRLLLFWLRLMKAGQETGNAPSLPAETSLTSMTTSHLPGEPTVMTQAALCWSEYFSGKWQPTKTSDVRLPTVIWNAREVGSLVFKRRGLVLTVGERSGALRIGLEYDGSWSSSFLLYNTHSLPVRREDRAPESTALPSNVRMVSSLDVKFSLTYYGILKMSDTMWLTWEPVMPRDILQTWQAPRIVETHQEHASFRDPFFYEDSRHVFFVTTTEKPQWINDYPGYTIDLTPAGWAAEKIPDLVYKGDPNIEVKPTPWDDGGPVIGDPRLINPGPTERFMAEDAYIRRGLPSVAAVKYGERFVGPSGAIHTRVEK